MENKIKLKKEEEMPSCIKQGVFLNNQTTFKIGGKADFFAVVESISDLEEVIIFIKKKKLNFFILGGGSNTVFLDSGFKGVVIKNNLKGIEQIKENKDEVFLKVFSGEVWDAFVDYSINKKLWGFENLTAIPGTVGGAVVQNIGAYGKEIEENVFEVEVMDIKTGKTKRLKKKDLCFGYRNSVFKKKSCRDLFIISVVFILNKKLIPNISYKDLRFFFKNRKEKNITQKQISCALKDIRGKKFPDLAIFGTAGSFFKNVVVNKETFFSMQKKFPEISFFEVSRNKFKISSAWLIDKACGLQGFRVGNIGLFEKQSLVLVNFGDATARELFLFKEKIKKIVFKKTGIKIEEEVVLVEKK